MEGKRIINISQRYFADFSYNGTHYHGWQFQKNAISIQQVIEECLSRVLKTSIKIYGAGRTDTGVHAHHMMVHFDISMPINQLNANKKAINSCLGKYIKLNSIYQVKRTAQARFDAIGRTYQYHIHFEKDVFNQEFSYYLCEELNHQNILKAIPIIKNHTDFKCFSKSKSDVSHFDCKIQHIQWDFDPQGAVLTIKANRFLRGMVRCIVGTLIEIGKNKMSLDELKSVLECGDRTKAGYSVPAKGLFLTSIEYCSDIFLT